jgi:hypothetical protein
MANYNEPMSWIPPAWHQDYGNPQAELDNLGSVAQCLIEQLPQLSVGLSAPEEGMMLLIVTNHNAKVLAEIYSIDVTEDDNHRKYGVFLQPNSVAEEEHYTACKQAVVELLKSVTN